MKFPKTLEIRVASVETVTPQIKMFTLTAHDFGELPGFSAGSHIVVNMPGKERIFRNAYSLLGSPDDRKAYRIAVRRQEASRGGSEYMHDQVHSGDLLQITPPANLFALDRCAARQILIAGGIGITPFMSYLQALPDMGMPFELHYAYRSREHAAFHDLLADQVGDFHGYDASHGEYIQPRAILAAQPLGSHVYVCGPEGMIKSVIECAGELGWPGSHVHYEQFTSAQPGTPFKVSCARQNREIDVPADMSMLDALEAAGLNIPNLCRGGVCGQCETGLLEGEPEHRDSYLAKEERNCRIMPCVSRARGTRLVLDI